MKKMWRDSVLEARNKKQETRDLQFGEVRFQNQEQRDLSSQEVKIGKRELRELSSGESTCLVDTSAMDENYKNKSGFFSRINIPYSIFCAPVIAIFALISLSACNSDSKKAETKQQYTCSMHPQIVEDEPGNCPICGMDLTPIRGMHQSTHSADSILTTADNELNQETMVVENIDYTPEITMTGSVNYNTNQVKSISARVSGRVEKSFVKYNFESIKKGQLLLQVYSEELVAIQQEMLFLKSNNDTDLLNKTKTKLSLLGVSNQQINKILQTGKPNYNINIYSNYSGYLINPNTNEIKELQATNIPLNIKEGQYINSGDVLFKVFNNNSLWAEFYTNTLESNWLKVGSPLNLEINGKTIKSSVDFIQPFFKNNQNYKLVRVVLNNHNQQFKIGELATAKAKASSVNGLWINEQAVYQSGEKNLVFLKTKNELKPKEVQLSAKSGNKVLVKKGLTRGDEIAVNASYLTDSESFIQTK